MRQPVVKWMKTLPAKKFVNLLLTNYLALTIILPWLEMANLFLNIRG